MLDRLPCLLAIDILFPSPVQFDFLVVAIGIVMVSCFCSAGELQCSRLCFGKIYVGFKAIVEGKSC